MQHTAAEERKISKYSHLGQAYLSVSVVIETLGVFGPKTLAFVRELGRRTHQETGEEIYSNKLPHAVPAYGHSEEECSCSVGIMHVSFLNLHLLIMKDYCLFSNMKYDPHELF